MNRFKCIWLVLLLVAGAFFIFADGASASQASAKASYQKASDNLRRLTQSPQKRKFRHLWEKAISGFDGVMRKYPGSEYAAKAMLAKADAFSGLYKISRNQKDLDSAIETYEQLISQYPRSGGSAAARARLKAITGVEPAAAQAVPVQALTEKKPAAKVEAATNENAAAAFGEKTGIQDRTEAPETATNVSGGLVEVRDIRHWSNAGYTRVVLDIGAPVKLKTGRLKNPDRLIFDLKPSKIGRQLQGAREVKDGILRSIRASQYNKDTVRIVLDLDSLAKYKTLLLPNPQRLVIDVSGRQSVARKGRGPGRLITIRSAENTSNTAPLALAEQPAPAVQRNTTSLEQAPQVQTVPRNDVASEPATAEQPATEAVAAGTPQPAILPKAEESVPRPITARNTTAVCIGTIVIDPGHGGKDTGAIGKNGLLEKDVVLDIGIRLREIIHRELGCKTVMTRDRDVFIDLSARPGVAIKNDADLFISIHANASLDRSARGIETYLLNTTKDRNIMKLAAMENGMTFDKMSDLYTIIKDLKLDSKREESLRLAHVIQANLVKDLNRHSRLVNDKGVKQGPFLVLYGAEMPSILTEVGFISNPDEEELLASHAYRQRIAEAIFDGIKGYIAGMKITATAARAN